MVYIVRSIMKIFLIASLFTSTFALSNPVATALVEKKWERCVICAGEEFSTVSCAVGYEGKDLLNQLFYVSVPVVLPEAMAADTAKIRELIKARLEMDGQLCEPNSIEVSKDPVLPEGIVKVNFEFILRRVPGKSFAMVASYEQPTINGKVFYLPQFEDGKDPKDLAEFSVSVFPTGGCLLSLDSKHKLEATVFATRITVKPVHREIIKVGIK